MKLIKIAQQVIFSIEIKLLNTKKPLNKDSKILALTPFIDDHGLLRVGGRLQNASLQYDNIHQIILPKNHTLTKLIAKAEHLSNLHCGQQQLLNSLRQKYWPLGGRTLAKQICHNCTTCFKFNARPLNQKMRNLPTHRVNPSPPFYLCDVDFAGPFYTRDRRSRGYRKFKAYVCLCICFCTKAVHLELVSDLSSEAFLACLRRFVARRGVPQSVYSDNGTNFVGANNELRQLYTLINDYNESILRQFSNERREIQWHFIPPRSPHFGGLWESNIKNVKKHLSKVVGAAILTFEEFSTLLTQIEAILNSRPLSPLSSDPKDFSPLTPAHFLIGRSLTSVPDYDYTTTAENRLKIFERMQNLTQHFWKQWKREYIHQLQQRHKWLQSKDNRICEGHLVVLMEPNEPPAVWKLGRITKTHPGTDGEIRVVTVKTSNSEIRRPINKICVLPSVE